MVRRKRSEPRTTAAHLRMTIKNEKADCARALWMFHAPGESAPDLKLRQASGLRFSGGNPKHLCFPHGVYVTGLRPP